MKKKSFPEKSKKKEYWSELPFPSLGIFPTQGLNLGLPHCRQILYHLNYQGGPFKIRQKDKARFGWEIV